MIIEELKKEQVANEVKMFQYATDGKRKKNSEEVSRGRRKTSASENSTDIWEKLSTSMAI